ncbi:MAG: UDP-glucose--sterol glucosyltransferase [Pseudonocardiales bacterium]|jgi:UDP:flavonoid glycosyltransferase YjiC (YdhE family)|nr:UDP-glucose--sterol glucosyltransferase [Pseudonocardiales bacterium]
MRIQIVTAGTLGSVAPYTGLGHRLRTEGHYVEVVTHAKFSGVVACCGLQMRVLEADPFEQLIGAHNKFHHGDRSPAGVLRLVRASQHAALGLVDGILNAVDPTADLILLSTIVAPIGTVVAQYHGIPSMGVFLQPDTPTTAFSPCVTAWKPPGNGNRVRGRVVHAALDSLYGPANRRLHARLGLPRRSGHRLRRIRERSEWPVWHGYSPTVVPRPVDWHPQLRVAGYWWPHTCPHWTAPALVTDFLSSGPPPVFIGFGSMMPGNREQLSDIAGRALRQARLRGVVQSGWAGLSVMNDDVITIGNLPHDWLLPRMAAAVHHAGAGTTGAGLRAGVPAVPVPVLTDQPWWASRLVQLGVSPEVVPHSQLTPDRLAAAMTAATSHPRFGRRAAELAIRLADEDGAGAVSRAVATLTR